MASTDCLQPCTAPDHFSVPVIYPLALLRACVRVFIGYRYGYTMGTGVSMNNECTYIFNEYVIDMKCVYNYIYDYVSSMSRISVQ